ncbi:MAG: hypothetical protein NTX82_04895 [Candidatus Parcubacteria bacterium]|nr:hypothetical protein [Candidatus Parcubacteria bacterium]
MSKLKFTLVLLAVVTLITACNLKVNLNSNLNQSSIRVEPNANQNQNINQPAAEANANTNTNQLVANEIVDFTFEQTDDGMIKDIINKKSNEVWIGNLKELCGAEVMIYAHPTDSMKVILTQFNPGSDKPVRSLYLLYLQNKTCNKLAVSEQLADFGARVLSPDQTKLAVALETNEAKELKILDLIVDTSKTLVTLTEGETLNGGYGSLSNKFDIKWLDNEKIQYTVYEDTVKNYPNDFPAGSEKVKEVRIENIR